ncbi:MAG TPA: maleylpyruvate isomerase family mycothiol-dependent enzyme [Acidimicrobiales bacterium]|jgi:uncharacterized protein (TIGR03083 family)|nr:maleylpyruvate isomerase family mycothiol-dependent enzyme [Acidimicrobiales bacterium]
MRERSEHMAAERERSEHMAAAVATTIDRFHGVEPGPEAVAGALATQRARMLELFRTFDEHQWRAATRCSVWTVQDVARHLVDVANLDSALQRGEGPRTPDGRIDPRNDPATWLAESDGQTPAETVAAFEVAAEAERAAFERRIRDGDDELLPGPYGPLHWAALGAHLFWDAWLHERDVVVPLGLPHEPTLAENRLAALYALTVSSTVPTFFGSTLTFSIELTSSAPGVYVIDASAESTRVWFTGTNGDAKLRADLEPLLDSLAGRGADVIDVVDGPADVIEPLTLLRDFLLPTD